jgi:hypothetical protein
LVNRVVGGNQGAMMLNLDLWRDANPCLHLWLHLNQIMNA